MSATRKAVGEFYFHMARHTQATTAQCERLLRYAATLQRLAVEQCNREWTERDERKRESLQDKVKSICLRIEGAGERGPLRTVCPRCDVVQTGRQTCKECGAIVPSDTRRCWPVFSNDPRGACLKIAVPDGFYTDWGKEGICVPA